MVRHGTVPEPWAVTSTHECFNSPFFPDRGLQFTRGGTVRRGTVPEPWAVTNTRVPAAHFFRTDRIARCAPRAGRTLSLGPRQTSPVLAAYFFGCLPNSSTSRSSRVDPQDRIEGVRCLLSLVIPAQAGIHFPSRSTTRSSRVDPEDRIEGVHGLSYVIPAKAGIQGHPAPRLPSRNEVVGLRLQANYCLAAGENFKNRLSRNRCAVPTTSQRNKRPTSTSKVRTARSL